MDAILESLPLYMMIGIVIVIGISQFNRAAGGALGVVFWISVLIIGNTAYDRGGGIGLPGFKFPREGFYALCLVFAGLHGLTAYTAFKRRGRMPPKSKRAEDEE